MPGFKALFKDDYPDMFPRREPILRDMTMKILGDALGYIAWVFLYIGDVIQDLQLRCYEDILTR